ncbi:MAG: GTP-binding protein, partial [Planctomycetes bacterium]|nr:GTP-binding protein [Planctomycetota bacterium]
LFNMLSGKRISIVDPTAGVTRDRISSIIESDGQSFELVDTGGYGIEDPDQLTAQIQDQIRRAIESAEVLLLVVDAKTGPVPLDTVVAQWLRPYSKPVILAVNKVDGPNLAANSTEFYSLGFDDMVLISCQHRRGKEELLKGIFRRLGRKARGSIIAPELKLAVVGKRNVGKSTLINTLAGLPRVIVSEVPGTTRDSIDVRMEMEGRTITVIDTA